MSNEYSTSPKVRIESLSDLVFGLALSIGSLTLIGKLPQTAQDLVTDIVLFGFSFLVVVLIWIGYTRTMAILSVEVRGAFVLNLALLFGVAIEPFLFYVLQSQTAILDIVSEAYAIDIGAMYLVLGAMVYLALSEEKKRKDHKIHPMMLKRLKRILIADLVAGSSFFVSAIPFLWIPLSIGINFRFDIWYANFAIFFAQRYLPLRDSRA